MLRKADKKILRARDRVWRRMKSSVVESDRRREAAAVKYSAVLSAALLLSGCSHVQKDGMVPDVNPYLTSAGSLPALETPVKFTALKPKMSLASTNQWSLSLTLGDRWTAGENNLNRSQSRYRLTSFTGRVLAEGESIFARGDEDDPNNTIEPKINVYQDSSALTILIGEHRHVALPRYILMRAGGGARPEGAPEISWDVRYLEFPFTFNGVKNGVWEPNIQGVRNGKLYLRIGPRLYAVPFEKIESLRDPGFQIG